MILQASIEGESPIVIDKVVPLQTGPGDNKQALLIGNEDHIGRKIFVIKTDQIGPLKCGTRYRLPNIAVIEGEIGPILWSEVEDGKLVGTIIEYLFVEGTDFDFQYSGGIVVANLGMLEIEVGPP